MNLATLGTKYQVVIPKKVRKTMKGLNPGIKVSIIPIDEYTATLKIEPNNWVERTAGIATEAWKNINPITELEKGRDEWEERLKKLGR